MSYFKKGGDQHDDVSLDRCGSGLRVSFCPWTWGCCGSRSVRRWALVFRGALSSLGPRDVHRPTACHPVWFLADSFELATDSESGWWLDGQNWPESCWAVLRRGSLGLDRVVRRARYINKRQCGSV